MTIGIVKVDFETFCNTVDDIYEKLPQEIKDNSTIFIEEFPTPAHKTGNPLFGYWNGLTPNVYTLCYWGFKAANDFRYDHIERVMKHEFEHTRFGINHSEHK